ncbi:MAG: hypothetical protein KAS32_11980 [Candidatus Peribacteraceae bacterium]|nr:hypothetical protein [Candidatus Peribacteraceae bacterium]
MEFLKSMIQSFENLFVRQNCVDDINSLIELIEEKMPIQPFLDDSSFSSIFLPFHIGTILHNNGEVKFGDIDYINKQLREFCSIAAEIEKRTSGIFAEPTENKKSELKNLLIQFKKLLPSKEVFCDWCASSEKQEKPHPPKAEG